MEEISTAPPLTLYVVWHPHYTSGERVGSQLLDHFGSHRFTYVSGGDRVRVMFRNAIAPGAEEPMRIDWDRSQTTAVVVLLDHTLVSDPLWANYVWKLVSEAQEDSFRNRVIPVAMEDGVLHMGLAEQALRWHDWVEPDEEKEWRLVRELKYTFSRMLRHRLTELRHPIDDRDSLGNYLEKVKVFLSHSKHDAHGETVAGKLRTWLNDNANLATFLDIPDIPPGVPFDLVIDHEVDSGVMVAIHTDSYSSREWCRREVVRAKRLNVPMLTVDCLKEVDERAFPYLGNVPSVRMNPETVDHLPEVAGCIMDEVFKDFLWQCRVDNLRRRFPGDDLPGAGTGVDFTGLPSAGIRWSWLGHCLPWSSIEYGRS